MATTALSEATFESTVTGNSIVLCLLYTSDAADD